MPAADADKGTERKDWFMTAYCGGLFFLAGLVKEDIEERKISINKIIVFGSAAVFYLMLMENVTYKDVIQRMLPGMTLLLLALVSKESIGYGDGMSVLVLGLWTGAFFTLSAVCIGIWSAGIWSLICLFRRRKEPIPFIPFLLFGTEVALIFV